MATTARERRRQMIRADIVEATLRLIEDAGIGAVTIESISEAAGVARATVYAHFPDGREEMLRAAYDQAGQLVVEKATQGVEGVVGWDSRILSYARNMIEMSSTAHFGRFYSVTGPSLVGFREGGGVGSRGYREMIGAELEAARASGQLRVDADPHALAVLLTSALRDAGIAVARDPNSAERYVGAIRTILSGLKTDGGTERRSE